MERFAAPLEGVVFDQLVRSNLKLPLQPHDPTTRWQRDRKKQQQQQLGLEGNTKTLHVPHTFLHFSTVFARVRREIS